MYKKNSHRDNTQQYAVTHSHIPLLLDCDVVLLEVDVGSITTYSLNVAKNFTHVFRYLTISQIPMKTSIWHTLSQK